MFWPVARTTKELPSIGIAPTGIIMLPALGPVDGVVGLTTGRMEEDPLEQVQTMFWPVASMTNELPSVGIEPTGIIMFPALGPVDGVAGETVGTLEDEVELVEDVLDEEAELPD